jgi:hypothetical protein
MVLTELEVLYQWVGKLSSMEKTTIITTIITKFILERLIIIIVALVQLLYLCLIAEFMLNFVLWVLVDKKTLEWNLENKFIYKG